MKSSTYRVVALFSIALIVTIVAVLLIQQRNPHGAPSDGVVSTTGDDTEPIGESPPNPQNPSPPNRSANDSINVTGIAIAQADLRYHCPSATGELTEGCIAALDALFLKEKPYGESWVPAAGQPTWEEVFDDPIARREEVLRISSSEQCTVEADKIRTESSPECNPQNLVTFSTLLYECTRSNGYRSFGTEMVQTLQSVQASIEETPYENPEQYREYRAAHEREFFRQAWLAQRCRNLPEHTLDPLSEAESEVRVIAYGDDGKPMTDAEMAADEAMGGNISHMVQRHLIPRNKSRELLKQAAQLGHEWALSRHRASDKLVQELMLIHPAIALQHRQQSASLATYRQTRNTERDLRQGLEQQLIDIGTIDGTEQLNSMPTDAFRDWINDQLDGDTNPEAKRALNDYLLREEKSVDDAVIERETIKSSYTLATAKVLERQGVTVDLEKLIPSLDSLSPEEIESLQEKADGVLSQNGLQ